MNSVPRVVCDTNTLVSGLLFRGNERKILGKAVEGLVVVLLSAEILEEFTRVISRPRFGYTERQVESFVETLRRLCQMVETRSRLDCVREDLADNRVLECAVDGEADYLVSGDRHLLKLGSFRGIQIVRSSTLLKELE